MQGMWAEPDNMRDMMATKGAQLEAGASTAWVPSPTAATLHALHYLHTNVGQVQASMTASQALQAQARHATPTTRGTPAHLADVDENRRELLRPPLLTPSALTELGADEISRELDANVQSLLGYVVRWVGSGVGCSKVPSIDGVGLMEDRATLRISSQAIANWRHHAIVSDEQILEAFHRIARLVDEQNASDPSYTKLTPKYDSPEWHAALELVFSGLEAPNGYTEHTLTKWRRERKAIDAGSAANASMLRGSLADARARPVIAGIRRGGNSMSGAA